MPPLALPVNLNKSCLIDRSNPHDVPSTHPHNREARRRSPMEVIIGCVGKPSVGKSTFFNAVTDGKVRVRVGGPLRVDLGRRASILIG